MAIAGIFLERSRLTGQNLKALPNNTPTQWHDDTMPFIIWGSRGITSTVGSGDFYCPQCDESDVMYTHRKVRPWFTVYFIPIFPIGGGDEYIECRQCQGTFNEKVLDIEPPTAIQRVANAVYERMRTGLGVTAARNNLIDQGLDEATATEFVDNLSGGETWECPTCGEHYLNEVKKCKPCRISLT